MYRVDFFDLLSKEFGDKMQVYYSPAELGVITKSVGSYSWANPIGATVSLFPGAEWQNGTFSIPINRGDIVVISGGPRCFSNIVLLLRARICGAKSIWWGQYWSATTKKYRLLLRLLLMKLADGVMFYTDDEVNLYQKTQGNRDDRPISALNNGLNIRSIRSLRAPYTPAARGSALLFIGRLTEKAHFDILLYALSLPILAKAHLHVIGDGQNDGDYKLLAAQLGLENRVVWHQGTTNEQDIAHIANECALFVYPGSVGLSLIHAMAYGLPAIVHDNRKRHMPEIAAFSDMVTGKAFQMQKSDALAESIKMLLDNADLRTVMSARSVSLVDSNFNTETMAQRFTEMVEKLLKSTK